MDLNVRKQRIKELQLKNRRENIIKEMNANNIEITLDSFLDVQFGVGFLKELFIKIDKQIVDKLEINFEHSKDVAIQFLSELKLKMPFNVLNKKVILFHKNHLDTGPIILDLEDVFADIDWIVDFSGYTIGAFDFIVVEPDLSYGVCIERWEYKDTYVLWGLLN